MKTFVSFFVAFCFLVNLNVFSQSNQEHTTRINTIFEKYFKENIHQKLYLHLDRNFYFTGDTIWFKSYLINAQTNQLDTANTLVFLDFVDINSKQKQKFVLESKDGISTGSIVLQPKFHSGNWQLIAYTQNMRNFSENYFSRQNIIIINSATNDSLIASYQSLQKYEQRSIKRKEKRLSIDNYWLYDDVNKSYSAVLLIKNKLEKAVSISGSFNSGSQKIMFESTDKGIALITNINEIVSPSVLIQSKKFKLETPLIADKFRIEADASKIHFFLDKQTENSRFLAHFSSASLVQLFDMNEIAIKDISINKSELKSGLNWFCVLSSSYDIIYQEAYFKPVNSTLLLEKASEKLMFSSQFNETATLSLSIYNVPDKAFNERTNIQNSFFINQEVPQYFSSGISDVYIRQSVYNYPYILNQKWSKAIYNDINKILISGKVVRLMNIGVANRIIRLSNSDDYYSTSEQFTIEGGEFAFSPTNVVDSAYFLIDAIKEKGLNTHSVILDTIAEPILKYKYELNISLDFSNFYLKNNASTNTWLVQNTQLIRQIEMRNKQREKNNGTIYGVPDYVIKLDDRHRSYSSLLEVLASAPGITMIGNIPVIRGISSIYGSSTPLVLLDNIPVGIDILSQLSPTDVDRIEILKSPANTSMFGSRGGNGVIAIVLRQGEFNTSFAYHFSTPGFPAKRKFNYKSDMKILELKKRPAYTLLWKDNIGLDENGRFEIPNSELYKGAFIRIEGISKSGKLIFFEQKL